MAHTRKHLFLLMLLIVVTSSFRGRGYIAIFQCDDEYCLENCIIAEPPQISYFGYCLRDMGFPGTGLIKQCHPGDRGDRIVTKVWDNEDCNGEPTDVHEDAGCILNPVETGYVKFRCMKWRVPPGELRTSPSEEKGTSNGAFNIILVLVFGIVYITGIIVGCIIQKRKKKQVSSESCIIGPDVIQHNIISRSSLQCHAPHS